MDHYLNSENAFNRLVEEYGKYNSLVVAFDFDDTVYDFHKKGNLYHAVIELLRDLKQINCHLICWTGQQDLEFVAEYLIENHIPFDGINENPPFYKSSSRKIYANVFLDDRAGLKQVYGDLKQLLRVVRKEETASKLEIVSVKIHELWCGWATEMLNSEPGISEERKKRWTAECFIDYQDLSEEMKNLDRKVAAEIIELI